MCQLTAKILNSDLDFCMSHPVENELWYKGVYAVIELMRCVTAREVGQLQTYPLHKQTNRHMYSDSLIYKWHKWWRDRTTYATNGVNIFTLKLF